MNCYLNLNFYLNLNVNVNVNVRISEEVCPEILLTNVRDNTGHTNASQRNPGYLSLIAPPTRPPDSGTAVLSMVTSSTGPAAITASPNSRAPG